MLVAGVKESAAWALGYIARHNAELAQMVVDAGAVALLVLCVQEPELNLKSIAASALSDIAKHGPELAQAVVDAGKDRGEGAGGKRMERVFCSYAIACLSMDVSIDGFLQEGSGDMGWLDGMF